MNTNVQKVRLPQLIKGAKYIGRSRSTWVFLGGCSMKLLIGVGDYYGREGLVEEATGLAEWIPAEDPFVTFVKETLNNVQSNTPAAD